MAVKTISEKRQLVVNLTASITAFMVNAAINFFLSPYIVATIGVEANGFIQLASNFASFISLVTIALNSMSSRFITIELTRGDEERAISYYTSIFWANIVLFTALLVPMLLVVLYLDSIVNIPIELIVDVKVLFTFAFANLIFVNILSVWNSAFYATNRLYLQYAGDAITVLTKAGLIVVLFVLLAPHVWYMTLAAFLVVPITVCWSLWNKHRLLPNIRVKNMLFSITRLKEVIASGIWRSIQSAGEMLLSGFDLLICNIFINPTAMGVLALSKVLPMLVQGLNWQMAASFGPKLTIDYAKADRETLWRDLRRAFKITSVIGTIPLAGIIVFGREFFELWVPSQDANVLQVLSILACFWMALVAGIQPAGNAFVATNKVKPQALSVIISGVVNIVAVLIVLQLTDHGIYAIAATSVAIGLARNLLYTIPAAARYLGFKWSKFYIGVLYSMTCTAIVLALGNIVKLAINPGNWLMLIIAVAITVVLSLVISGVVVFSKSELRSLLASTSNMVTKWKGRQ